VPSYNSRDWRSPRPGEVGGSSRLAFGDELFPEGVDWEFLESSPFNPGNDE